MGKGMSGPASQENTLSSSDHETALTKALFFGQPKPLRFSGVLRSAQICGFPGRRAGVQQAGNHLHRQADAPRVAIRVLGENLRPSRNAVA